MSQSNYPYYNYQTYPQAYTPYAGANNRAGQYPFQQPQPQAQQAMPGAQMTAPPPGVTPSANGTGVQVPGMLPAEASYVENILRLNKGKLATVYMSFDASKEWNSKIFKGIIEAAGRDHLILSDPQTGVRYLLLMVYLDYVTFDEEIEYDYPYGAAPGLSVYPPR
ncbi:spore coat protein GerQ [Mesobacillus maritimus]|uniref:spore coat protein GerQ n=1 Tax=Mesobacillus maritimus TaxID=1643336 RepID=UPI0032E80041